MAATLLARGVGGYGPRCHPWGGGLVPRTALGLLVGALAIGGSLACLRRRQRRRHEVAPGRSTSPTSIPVTSPRSTSARTPPAAAIGTDDGAAADCDHARRGHRLRRQRPRHRVTPIDIASNTPGDPIDVNSQPHGDRHHTRRRPRLRRQCRFEQRHGDRRRDEHEAHRHRGRLEPSGDRDHAGWRRGIRHEWDSNDVTPIDVATRTAGAPIPVGAGPSAIAITPDGDRRLRHERRAGRASPGSISPRAPLAHDRVETRPAWRSPSRPTAPRPTSPT